MVDSSRIGAGAMMKEVVQVGRFSGVVERARRFRRAVVRALILVHQNAPGNGYASVVIRGRTSAAQLIFSLQLHPQSFRVSVLVPGRPLISKRRRWNETFHFLLTNIPRKSVENLRAVVFVAVKTIERLFIFRIGEI